jgi:hypothetical protein
MACLRIFGHSDFKHLIWKIVVSLLLIRISAAFLVAAPNRFTRVKEMHRIFASPAPCLISGIKLSYAKYQPFARSTCWSFRPVLLDMGQRRLENQCSYLIRRASSDSAISSSDQQDKDRAFLSAISRRDLQQLAKSRGIRCVMSMCVCMQLHQSQIFVE